MEHKIPLDASVSRSRTMIRTKPTSPTPYLDPIVTRRRPSLKSGGPARARVDPTGTKPGQQLSFANKQFEDKGSPKPFGLKNSVGNQYMQQRRKTVVSADCNREKNSDLAYLVVNLQENLSGRKSSEETFIQTSRRRNTMSSTVIGDKSMQKTTFQGDALKRRSDSVGGVAMPTSSTAPANEDCYEEGEAVVVDGCDPPTKKSSINRPVPPPPPPYMPPSPPRREFNFPVENLSACSLEPERDSLELSSSCPNLPPKRRLTKRNPVGKTSSLGYSNEKRSTPEVSNHQVATASPGTSRKKTISEQVSRSSSNAPNRLPPHKPRPYTATKTTPPSCHPNMSPEASRRRTSEGVDGPTKASPTSPPVLPKKSSLSTTNSPRHEGLTTSISSPSLHMRPVSPSKPNVSSNHTRQHSLSIHPSPQPSPQQSRSESRRGSTISQQSPPRRPAPPRPAPFVLPQSASRPIPPPTMLSSPELGSPTKKPPKKKRTSESAITGMKETTTSRESRSSTTSINGSLRNRIISGPILKSTTISLDKSQPILNSVTDSPKLLAKNPTHASHCSAVTAGKEEAIYEDVDKLHPVDSSARNPKPTAQPKPALPSRNRRPIKHNSGLPSTYSTDSPNSRGGTMRGNSREQVYEELDASDSEECTTMDNAAYITNIPIQEAWLTLDEDGLYVDDLYVEMRPVSGSPPEDAENATYMEMQPTLTSPPSLQVTPPPASPAPSNSRDSVGSLPAPASPAPIYEYADLSVVSRKKTHKPSAQHSSLPADSESLYYASKDLLTSK